MNAQLEKCLRSVEGGTEVLAARKRELSAEQPLLTEAAKAIHEEGRLMLLEQAGVVKRGTGRLPEEFWKLARPDNPKDSVRRALDEDRG